MKRHMRITAFILCMFIGLFFLFQFDIDEDRDGKNYDSFGQEAAIESCGTEVPQLVAVHSKNGRQWNFKSVKSQVFPVLWGISENMENRAKYGFSALLLFGTFLLAQSLDILRIIQKTDGKKREHCVCFLEYAK